MLPTGIAPGLVAIVLWAVVASEHKRVLLGLFGKG
jgi:hypothetical protein